MTTQYSFRRNLSLIAVTTLIATFGFSLSASAENQVTFGVTGGSLSATIANVTLTALNYAHSTQNQTGTLSLTADDSTGSGDGWQVTIEASDFVYSGTAVGGSDILASNFAITTADAPTWIAGQTIDLTNGPKVGASPTGTLDQARTVIESTDGYGLGTYSQDLDVNLMVPAQSRAGSYVSTLTVTIAATP